MPSQRQPLHNVLMENAQHFLNDGRQEAAVIFAQIAVEVLTEAVISHWASEENVEWIVEIAEDSFSSYNPSNERVRQLLDKLAEVNLTEQNSGHGSRLT